MLLVDDEFGCVGRKIRASLRRSAPTKPVRFVVNTHYHFDHTDGNLAFAAAGATVIAHDNLRTRLASGGTIGNGGSIAREVKPADAGALPTITYERELTVHLNGEDGARAPLRQCAHRRGLGRFLPGGQGGAHG